MACAEPVAVYFRDLPLESESKLGYEEEKEDDSASLLLFAGVLYIN